jgi:RNA polymerase sigma-70 factor (ECF subfamily)
MANLSLDRRQVMLLRFVDDLTIDEIAAAMAIPAGTVKSRLHHAIAALRQDPRIRKYFDFP